jgi:hypothetical protein
VSWSARGGLPKNTLLLLRSRGLLTRLLFGCVFDRRAPGNLAALLPDSLTLPVRGLLRHCFFFAGFSFREDKAASLRGKICLFCPAGIISHFFISGRADEDWLFPDGPF